MCVYVGKCVCVCGGGSAGQELQECNINRPLKGELQPHISREREGHKENKCQYLISTKLFTFLYNMCSTVTVNKLYKQLFPK